MALAPITRTLSQSAYTCLNPSNPATAEFSFFPVTNFCWLKATASATVPTDDDGAILVPPSTQGGGIIGQTVAQLFAGSAYTYLHARYDDVNAGKGAVIACA